MAEHQKKSISFTIESILGETEGSRSSASHNPHVAEILSSTERKVQSHSIAYEKRSKSLSRNDEEQFKLNSDAGISDQLGNIRVIRQRKRNLFTPGQVRELVKCFRRKRYLSAFERESLARRIDLSPKQVMIWFQNYRYKCRRLQKLGISKENQDIDIFDDVNPSTKLDNQMKESIWGCRSNEERHVNVEGSAEVKLPLSSEVTLSMADFSLLLTSSLMYPHVYNFGSAHFPNLCERHHNTY